MNRKAGLAVLCLAAVAGMGWAFIAPPRPVRPAPIVAGDPPLRDLDGRPVRLGDLRGRIVLLSFFSGT